MFLDIWYRIGRLLVIIFASFSIKIDIYRKSALPDGAFILTANHPSLIDPAMVTLLTKRRLRILILETLFKIPLFGRSLRWSGHIPVLFGQGQLAFESARQTLDNGGCLAIFPEGVITPIHDGSHKGHTGAARLALQKKVPVIPVGIALIPENIKLIHTQVEGKSEVGTWYLHGPYAITVGEPLFFYGNPENREYVQYVTNQILHRIYQLTAESELRIRESEQRLPWVLGGLQAAWSFVIRSLQTLGRAGMI